VSRVVGYARIGPREREDARPSLDVQRRGLENAARARGWDLLRVEEDVRSGRSLRRPGLRAAIAACRAGEADGIAVVRLDRLTYSLADLAELVREAVEGGYTIVALQPHFDLASESGRALGEVLAEAATWQPRAIEAAGRALTARPGRPSSVPTALAARIRALRAQGMTLQGICDVLNGEGVPTPRGGAEWRPTSLRSVLRA
jgi:DNA invertase Pin-like site-specific DNA recombinase